MRQYKNIVHKTVKGFLKPNRTGTSAFTVPFVHFEHDMSEGFPLLTTKKMPLRLIAVELEGFLKGITSKKWFQERNCHIWDQWCNPQRIPRVVPLPEDEWNDRRFIVPPVRPIQDHEKLEWQMREDDLGPVYGYQWRRFNENYEQKDLAKAEPAKNNHSDQLAEIVWKLKNKPDDRRMVCSAWNPLQLDEMALPPCHLLWNVVVIDNTLHLHWHQRSCDLMLGVPFNIASYGLLLLLLAKTANMKPGILSGMLADCHIYENHKAGVEEQMSREPRPLPTVEILTKEGEPFDIMKWEHTDYKLKDYNPHPRIDFGGVAV